MRIFAAKFRKLVEKATKRFTVTSALPYANGPIHIGHIAGAYLTADIFVRSLRSRDKEVLFICGSDEHGAAITMRAQKDGVSAQAIVDKYHGMMQKAFQGLGIDFDIYHRTSSQLHHDTAQEFFLNLAGKDVFEVKRSEQYFDDETKQFLADRFITGTCPKCSYEAAYGDQCENCGSALSPIDLISPRSTLTGSTPIMKETFHWYLPMDKHQEWLEEWLNKGTLDGAYHHDPKKWKPQVLGQCNSWLKDGLRSRAMTRDLEWGVKVPLPDGEGKVLYVWLDAPIGYISATKQWAIDRQEDWEKWWKDPESELVHFIGKDNIVFHAIIFPILLKAHGQYNLPTNVPANEFLNLEGEKISTSRNWAVWLHEYLERWPGREDELRYVLGSLLPEYRDSEFTWKEFQERNNNELVAVLGNFVNRVMVLCDKYYAGKAPGCGLLDSDEKQMWVDLDKVPQKVAQEIDRYRFRDALNTAMGAARLGNKYLTESEPWKVQKTDPSKAKTILHNCLRIMGILDVVLEPFLPNTAVRIRAMAGMKKVKWDDALSTDRIQDGQKLGATELLFKRIEDEEVDKEREILEKMSAEREKPTTTAIAEVKGKQNIAFDQFAGLELKVGTIKQAERVAKADKLLQLMVDVGTETRTVVSGIAEHYSVEEVLGQQVLLLCNLEPRKIRGVISQGMILMAEDEEGKLCFMAPSIPMPVGSEVR